MKIKTLISILKNKDQNLDVEFIVADKKGNLVCIEINKKAQEMEQLLKLFSK